jgi:hypothetical protein
MKKLLTLMLVLGMTSLASAALNISVDGVDHPVDSEIILDVSQTVILDVWSDIDIAPGGEGENQYWVLACQTSCGLITNGVAVLAGGHADWYFDGPYDDAVGVGIAGLPEGENGVVGYIATLGEPIPAGTLFDEIIFHCESLNGPTVVTLYECDSGGVVIGVWDTVTIHQIPEPASMLLLGLGGLLLRRRK